MNNIEMQTIEDNKQELPVMSTDDILIKAGNGHAYQLKILYLFSIQLFFISSLIQNQYILLRTDACQQEKYMQQMEEIEQYSDKLDNISQEFNIACQNIFMIDEYTNFQLIAQISGSMQFYLL